MSATSDVLIPRSFRINRIDRETADTFTLELGSTTDDQTHFPFAAGQFNMLYLFGVGEVPISISGKPADPKKLIHTIRAVGTVTEKICALKVGDLLGVRGPFGTNWNVEIAEGNDVVIVTGGIGLAPLRPAIYQLINNREKYGHVSILYGARSPAEILYRQELETWRGHLDLSVEVTVDNATKNWRGDVGVVTTLIPRANFDPIKTTVMICGPEIMMHFTLIELRKRGVPIENIYVSMERNMKCAIGFCGHCQFGSHFVCKDGPVFRYDAVQKLFGKREI